MDSTYSLQLFLTANCVRRQASHCKWKWHPPQFQGAMKWIHTCPTVYGTIHPHLAAPTYGALSPTTYMYPSLQVSAAFSLQVHHTTASSRGQWNHHPPLITASELTSGTTQVNLHSISPHCNHWSHQLSYRWGYQTLHCHPLNR